MIVEGQLVTEDKIVAIIAKFREERSLSFMRLTRICLDQGIENVADRVADRLLQKLRKEGRAIYISRGRTWLYVGD